MRRWSMNIYLKQVLEGRIIFLTIVLTYFIVLIWVFHLRPKSISQTFTLLGYGFWGLLGGLLGGLSIASEYERKTIGMLLGLPLSRTRMMLEKWLGDFTWLVIFYIFLQFVALPGYTNLHSILNLFYFVSGIYFVTFLISLYIRQSFISLIFGLFVVYLLFMVAKASGGLFSLPQLMVLSGLVSAGLSIPLVNTL